MCAIQTAPANGGLYNNRSILYYGDEQNFYCDIGYNLVGQNTSTCDLAGAWSNSAPSCVG